MLHSPGIEFGQLRRAERAVVLLCPAAFEPFKRNTHPLGQTFDRLDKCQILLHLDKFQHITAGPARKTLKYLFGRADIQTGAMIGVKRAQSNPFLAAFRQA